MGHFCPLFWGTPKKAGAVIPPNSGPREGRGFGTRGLGRKALRYCSWWCQSTSRRSRRSTEPLFWPTISVSLCVAAPRRGSGGGGVACSFSKATSIQRPLGNNSTHPEARCIDWCIAASLRRSGLDSPPMVSRGGYVDADGCNPTGPHPHAAAHSCIVLFAGCLWGVYLVGEGRAFPGGMCRNLRAGRTFCRSPLLQRRGCGGASCFFAGITCRPTVVLDRQ